MFHLTMGAGFAPVTMQTRVKFWASQRLKGEGLLAATTEIDLGGTAERTQKALKHGSAFDLLKENKYTVYCNLEGVYLVMKKITVK